MDLSCNRYEVLGLFYGWRLRFARITKHPGKYGQIQGCIKYVPKTWIKGFAIGRKFVQIMGFSEDFIMCG